jgi:uncharacterized membrane protein
VWDLGLALASVLPMLAVCLRQLGIPDPPLPGFCADRVTTSRAAHPFGIPDSLLWIPGAVADVLAATVARHLVRRLWWLAAAVLAQDLAFGLFALWLLLQILTRLKAWCVYCLVAGAARWIVLLRHLWLFGPSLRPHEKTWFQGCAQLGNTQATSLGVPLCQPDR